MDLRRNPTVHKRFLQTLRNLFPFGAHSDRTWAYHLNGDSFWVFPFAFAGTADLFPLGFLLEFSCGRLRTNSFCCLFGSLLLFAIRGDSFSGIPPCFPPFGVYLNSLFPRNSVFHRRGFTVLLLSWGTPCIPLAVNHTPICRKPSCPQGQPHLSEVIRADPIRCWCKGCHFSSRISLSIQEIPIFQWFVPFMPIRLYKRHGPS